MLSKVSSTIFKVLGMTRPRIEPRSPGVLVNTLPTIYIYIYIYILVFRVECSTVARETGVQSLVKSYQRLEKWYLMPSSLTLSFINYGSRLKSNNSRKRTSVVPYLVDVTTEKMAFGSPSTTSSVVFSSSGGINTAVWMHHMDSDNA